MPSHHNSRRAWLGVAVLAVVASAWLLLRRGDTSSAAPHGVESRKEPTPSPAVELGAAGRVSRAKPIATPPPPGAPAVQRVQVVNVRDDAPVANLEFKRRPSSGATQKPAPIATPETAGVSGSDGWLALEPSERALPSPTPDSGWRAVTTSKDEALRSQKLRVGRVVRITGSVRGDGTADRVLPLDRVRIHVVGFGPPDARLTTLSTDGPGSIPWLRSNRVDSIPVRSYDARTGEFEVAVPHLPWFGITASAPGWYAETVDLSERAAGPNGAIDTVLVLRPRRNVRGRVLGEDGEPVANAKVRVQVLVRSSLADFNPTRALIEGSSVTMSGNPDGRVVVNYASEYTTGPDGTYAVDLPTDGEAIVVASAAGRAPARSEFPATRDATVDLATPRRTGTSVRLLKGGSPVTDTRVLLHDMTDRDRQIPLDLVPVAPDGTVRTEWLEPGHDYMLQLSPSGLRCFVRWHGQTLVDFARESDAPANRETAAGK